ncbi:hypothetical protein ABID08_001300 [Rhizobium binae]|uniref:Uncharacterized protein n=1 Tax=Rhizobium binae TaxID=1138190 RepID=A0ABV2MF36_9HYPH|nr:hypothetical protein [Rhizobium binae]NKL47820.1 hypothetical protein [Rhizobium leguminosarum bv. viciae]MBX4929662.1 hypothetical protein [Rhizobium binae]MBX4953126.1 hypothetical protein [Rhizobium binae]MBX4967526.1 hypothetical protein [Rhizobium binae]MBX4990256.1 hypothetical protein [Rhizobium binae]
MIELSIKTSSAGRRRHGADRSGEIGGSGAHECHFSIFSVLLLVAEKIPYWQANVIMRNEL